MPYFAALAAAGALFYYLRGPQAGSAAAKVTHVHQGGGDPGGGDLSGQDLALLYLDELRSLHDSLDFGGGGAPVAGAVAAGVPLSMGAPQDAFGAVTGGGYGGGISSQPYGSETISAYGGSSETLTNSMLPSSMQLSGVAGNAPVISSFIPVATGSVSPRGGTAVAQ